MNRRRSKKINKQTISIFLEWIASVVPEEEAKKIDPNNYKEYVPNNPYYYKGYTLLNSLFSPRWIKRKLKRMQKINPERPIDTYTMADLK